MATAQTKPLAFDVVSIRQDLATARPQGDGPPFGPTADGYRITALPLVLAVMTAYPPQSGSAMFMPDQIKGLPDWTTRDRYDIQAKVADEDLAAWHKPATQATMLPAMMQAMLADRCKLAVHRETKETSVDVLILGKGGAKFKETNPDDPPPPGGVTLPGGAIMVRSNNSLEIYNTTMSFFATMLAGMANTGRPMEDRTGLTGRYHIIVKTLIATQNSGSAEPSDPGGSLASALAELGLKLSTSKSAVETLVVDHIERPTEN